MKDIKLSDDAKSLMQNRGLGELAERMGIELVELSSDYTEATMPVIGNRQPLGLVNGGAYLVLGETLGSLAANVWAHTLGKVAVGIEINASHSRSATNGMVKAICKPISLGKSVTVHEILCYDEDGNRLSTVRITNLIREKKN